MFVGSYTSKMGHATGKGKGISIYKFNSNDGSMKYIKTIDANECGPNPAAFYINSKANCMYICNECNELMQITQIKMDPNNNFNVLQSNQYESFGTLTNFISSDINENNVYITNFGNDFTDTTSVVIYKIDPFTNDLILINKDIVTENGSNLFKNRQKGSHFHYIAPCKRFKDKNEFYCADLGRDKIYHYKITNDNKLKVISSIQTKLGGGTRHFTYHPTIDGMYTYI